LRGSDIKCRYGGEEFLILLPDTRSEGAMRVAETLRRDLADTSTPWDIESVMVTASFGVAVSRPDELDAAAVIGRADAALYAAKQAGRNRVSLADDALVSAQPRPA
jgi:diguanylate cyclase (GGDEF)-like protein